MCIRDRSYTTQSVADFQDTSAKERLSPGASKSVSTSDSGWVIFNIQQTGESIFLTTYKLTNVYKTGTVTERKNLELSAAFKIFWVKLDKRMRMD